MSTSLAKANNPNAPIVLQIQVADEGELGPAMKALPTDRQRRFAVAMLNLGGRNNTRAAREAGYEGDDQSIRISAHRLAHDSRIQEAIREEGQRQLGAAVGLATEFLVAAIENPLYSAKDKLRAAEMLLNRTGLPAVTEQKVTVTHELSKKEQIARIEELAKKHGLDAKALLGDIVEGEFVEVPYDEHSTAGLEDLL